MKMSNMLNVRVDHMYEMKGTFVHRLMYWLVSVGAHTYTITTEYTYRQSTRQVVQCEGNGESVE